MQRTRCPYFYDTATPCNKREPGSGLLRHRGVQPQPRDPGHERALHRHAPVGHVRRPGRPGGRRPRRPGRAASGPSRSPSSTACPATRPHLDTNLGPDEIITAVDLPAEGFAEHHAYLKVRDRTSYAFALVSVAAALEMDGGTIAEARIALGGVAHKPWRDRRRRGAPPGPEPPTGTTSRRRPRRSCATPGDSAQRLQDRAGPAGDRPRPEPRPPGRPAHDAPHTSASRSAASTAAPR